jgi:protein transport protein SEC31
MLKRINKSANIAWAPLANQSAGLLAAGTAAGTVDNAFDFTSTLEIFDVRRPEETLQPIGGANCPDRFNKLVWSGLSSLPDGLIAGGMSNGTVTLWNPAKILSYV